MNKNLYMALLAALFFLSASASAGEVPASDEIKKLVRTLTEGAFSEKVEAEKKLLEIGAPAVPALLEAERDATGNDLVRLRRIRRRTAYNLTAELEATLASDLAVIEGMIKGYDWPALMKAVNHPEAETADLAGKILRKISRHYLLLLAGDDEEKTRSAERYFLDAPVETVALLAASAQSGKRPLAERAAAVLAKIVDREIARLSDPEPENRKRAEEALFLAGEAAAGALDKAAAGDDADLAFRAERLLLMIRFQVSPALYPKVGHVLADYEKSDWRKRREYIIEVERLLAGEAKPVLMAIIRIEKSKPVKETAGAALIRTAILKGGDLSIVKFLEKHGIINPKSIPAITIGIYVDQAHRYFDKKDYKKALAELEHAYRIDPKHNGVLYDMACCHSMLGNPEKAIVFLQEAVKNGFDDWRHMKRDTDLDNIREDARFKGLIRKLQSEDLTYDPEKEKEEDRRREEERKKKEQEKDKPGE